MTDGEDADGSPADVYQKISGMELADDTSVSTLQESAEQDVLSPLGGVIPDADMKLAEISLTFVDANGIQREWTRSDGEYDPADFHSQDSGESEDWEQKANENVQKWGLQSVDALLLAMGEEMGELAGEVHGMADYPDTDGEGGRMAEHGRDLIRRMDTLGRDIRAFLETVSEHDGEPVPEDERPEYLDPFPEDLNPSRRGRLIQSELDDLMALGHQFQWALESADEDPELVTDGGGTIPDDHRITAKTRGEAELETLPDPDDPYPSLNWNHGPSTEQHFQCSCGEPLDDSARSVVNHLIDVGAYDGEPMTDGGEPEPEDVDVEFSEDQLFKLAGTLMNEGVPNVIVESVVAELTDEERPPASKYVSASESYGYSVPEEMMNLARHLYHESRNLGGHVKDSEKHHGNELASAIYQARADGLMDACEEIRQVALWMDGERDRPASLTHGNELAAEGKRVPKDGPGGNVGGGSHD